MKGSKTRLLVSVAVVAVAVIILYFLVQDIYRLQKQYEQVLPPPPRIPSLEHWMRIRQILDEIQTMMYLRKMACVLVVAGTAVTLLFLNKPELFKRSKVQAKTYSSSNAGARKTWEKK